MDILQPLADIVTRRPREMAAAIVAITLVMMAINAANPRDPEFDQSSFLPDHEVIRAQEDISEKLASSRTVPVLVHARTPAESPNVLSSAAMVELLELEWALTNDTQIAANLTVPDQPAASFVSLPHLLGKFIAPNATSLAELLTAYRQVNDTTLRQTLARAGSIPGLSDLILSLVSKELTEHPGHDPVLLQDLKLHDMVAKAMLLLVFIDSTTAPGESTSQQLKRLSDVELAINDRVKEHRGTHLKAVVLSQTVLDEEVNEATQKTTQLLLGLAFLLIIVILIIIYRSFTDVVLSLLALIFTLVWVNGLSVIMGFESSVFSMIVPILLVGLGVDYGIHLTMRYRETLVVDHRVKQASTATIRSVGAALVLATLTTMVGFMSNASSPVGVMKEFGLTVALGILSAFIIFVTFVPACKVYLDGRRQARGKPLLSPTNEARARQGEARQSGPAAYFTRFLDSGVRLALVRPAAVVAAIIPLTLGMLLLASQLSTVFSFEDFLPDGLEITDEFRFMGDNFESPDESAFIYISGPVATPRVMAAIDAAQKNMEDDERVLLREGSPVSPLSVMRDWANDSDLDRGGNYNASFAVNFTAADTDGDRVPDGQVVELLDWVYQNHPDELASLLYKDDTTGEYSLALIKVNTNSENVQYVAEIHQELRDDSAPLEELEGHELDQVVVTGEPIMFDVVLTAINDSMLNSIVITVVVALVILTLVFYLQARSLVLGFLTTLPVILVMVWILGTMTLIDIPLNFLTILIGALTVGLGITYAIHITHRFVEELQEHGDIARAAHQTIKSTGKSLSGAAMTTMVGFGVLVFSVQPPMQQFGKLTALTILYSFLASVFVLPSLLVLWARGTQPSAPTAEPEQPPQVGPSTTEALEGSELSEGPEQPEGSEGPQGSREMNEPGVTASSDELNEPEGTGKMKETERHDVLDDPEGAKPAADTVRDRDPPEEVEKKPEEPTGEMGQTGTGGPEPDQDRPGGGQAEPAAIEAEQGQAAQ